MTIQLLDPAYPISQREVPQRVFPEMQQRQPGLMDLLGQGFAQGAGQGLMQGVQGAMQKMALQKAIGMLPKEGSLVEQLNAISQADPEAQQFLLQNYLPALQQQKQLQQQIERNRQEKLAQREHELEKIRLQNLGKLEAAQVRTKKGQKELETPEQKSELQGVIDRQIDILNKGNLGNPLTTFGALSRERQEDIGEFDSLNVALESIFKDMVNKGAMSDARFKFMIKNLPSAHDSDRKNKGKLKAIGQILDVDVSRLQKKGESSEKKGSSERIKIQLPDGRIGSIPAENIDKAIELKAKIIK